MLTLEALINKTNSMVCLFSPKKTKKKNKNKKTKTKTKKKTKKQNKTKKKKTKNKTKNKNVAYLTVSQITVPRPWLLNIISKYFFFFHFFFKKKIKGYHNNPYAKTNLKERG